METAISIARVGDGLRDGARHVVLGSAATDRIHILNGFAKAYAGANRDGAFSLKWMPNGAARYAVDGREHRLSGRRVLILEADQPYDVEFHRAHESESFCLFFSRSLVDEARETPPQHADMTFRPPARLGIGLQRLRTNLLELEQEPDLLEGAVLSLLVKLTDIAAEHRQIAQRLPARRSETRRRLLGQLQRAREMIQDHRGRPPLLSAMAAASGLSKFHFLRLFTAAYGIGPAAYAEHCRLSRADALLRQTALPIEEIAHRAGYDSQGAFAKAFRRRFGASPRASRKRAD